MVLAKRCRSDVPADVRDRGERYFDQGRVQLQRTGAGGVLATVVGSQGNYDVYLNWELPGHQAVEASCTCPYFEDGGVCKHIWATILAADARRLTAGAARGRFPCFILEADMPEDEDIEGLIDEFPSEHPLSPRRLMDSGFSERSPARETSSSASTRTSAKKSGKRTKTPPKKAAPNWKNLLQNIRTVNSLPGAWSAPPRQPALPFKDREAWYVMDFLQSHSAGAPVIALFQREQRMTGDYGKIKTLSVDRQSVEEFPRAEDRDCLTKLLATWLRQSSGGYGGETWNGYAAQSPYSSYRGARYSEIMVSEDDYDTVFQALAATGRFFLMPHASELIEAEGAPLAWDSGPPWKLRIDVTADDAAQKWTLRGVLARDGEAIPIERVRLAFRRGLVLLEDRLVRADIGAHFGWITQFRQQGPILVPYADAMELLQRLWELPSVPEMELPENLQLPEVRVAPVGRLCVKAPVAYRNDLLTAEIAYVYEGFEVPSLDAAPVKLDPDQGRVVFRDLDAEQRLLRRLADLGVQAQRDDYRIREVPCSLAKKQLPKIVDTLAREGWLVEAEGHRLRRPGEFRLSVTTGVDWFELDAEFDFDGEKVKLPDLLAALERGEKYVRLGDGSQGMLPEDWLAKYGSLAGLGEADEGKLRFRHSQAILLDALLSAQEQDRVATDKRFVAIREKLRSFSGVSPADPDDSFHGSLRSYQKQGLGWLHFLREYGFGGCLADDMGLGKTVQVLALLESRRRHAAENGAAKKPSLAVVPKSLVFNWIDEAKRFTPELRVLNYTGLGRAEGLERLDEFDLLVTTYGTLRLDIVKLKEIAFDYAILDESQAIKNAQSQAAKASRLIHADHRLAMTGTPVENHLGELWSLFEFLNPGLLGRSARFLSLSRRSDDVDRDALQLLSRGLAPFLLRRTKQQVLTELPEKSEQTLFCDLEGKQRKHYDELRDFYRLQLTRKIDADGMAKSKIVVLEALLRLRQAACHPGLLDKNKARESSAKFDVLLEQLDEVVSEGHKALVFSQFTSLLSLLRKQLDERNVVYEYLDGRTRNRKEKVTRFQEDANCPLFLISLKAGGHGLNLTAADYVFILDPWWNPAVEAQAVDRAHRIGQTRPVFAYRIIARDTVEEKILELQKTKRELAEAIIGADNSVLRSLTAEDLQLLLS